MTQIARIVEMVNRGNPVRLADIQWVLDENARLAAELEEEKEIVINLAGDVASCLVERDALAERVAEAEAKQRIDEAQCDQMTEDAGNMAVEITRLRRCMTTAANRLNFLLSDVERCGSLDNLTEKELPALHDRLRQALEVSE